MKSNLVFFLFVFFISFAYGQEICDNAIDDDGDGLIDLNDEDCDCAGFGGVIESLIPNPSFEEMDCCPDNISQLDCATTWVQASDATSDYFNNCDFTEIVMEGIPGADTDLMDGGDGWVGFWSSGGYKEYIGACLTGPLLGGTEYTLNFYTAWALGEPTLELSLYGSPDCGDLPWAGSGCPTGIGGWELLTSVAVTYPEAGPWQEVTVTFTPAVDMNAFAIGGPCAGPATMTYAYVDGLTLIDSESFSDITETGAWCDGDLMLEANTDTVGGSWQWYKDGIALIGETDPTVNVMLFGLGEYSAVYTVDDNCLRSDHLADSDDGVSAAFEVENICHGDESLFTNTSTYPDGTTPEWEWDFGDGSSSTDENPTHTYATAGTYTVELIGIDEAGCNDTIEVEVTVDPIPVGHMEFVIGGFSSEDGATGGCIASPVQFNDLSTIAEPGAITSWDWDFGDGGSSTEENPEHEYTSSGTYTVELTVTSENGCSATATIEIIMTESLSLDITYNGPSCYGFSDGSVTVNVTGGGDDLIFEITDESGELMNEDNSNTANSLESGWYYINVSNATECDGLDSVFLSNPEQLAADLTISDAICHGDSSGWVKVNEVFNAQGDIDNISYFWAPNYFGDEGVGIDSSYNMHAGDYTLTINDDNGCSVVIDITIEQPDSLYFSEFGSEPAYCRLFGYQSGNGVVYAGATGGTPTYEYRWENQETGDAYPNTTWGGLNPGTYVCYVTDDNGCTLERTIELDSLNPIADFNVISDELNEDLMGTGPVTAVSENQSLYFANPFNPEADTTFFWNLDTLNADDQITHDYFFMPDTVYNTKGQTYEVVVCLTAYNKNGCSDTECKIITIFEPIKFTDVNIFTPNGDGNNDVFTFEFRTASIAEFSCIIVNRWGVVMAELNDITDSWDGTDKNGDLVTDGVYYYSYTATTDNGNLLTGQGNITVAGSGE
ncbi:MAG: PKD domain-containing protein [Crocinitomicaceae bacterium]